jgi:hypothetical protein
VAAFTGLGGSFPVDWVATFTGIRNRLYLRTQSRDLPSEKSVKQIIAQLFVMQFFRLGQNGIIQQIRFYMMTISDEIDDD